MFGCQWNCGLDIPLWRHVNPMMSFFSRLFGMWLVGRDGDFTWLSVFLLYF